MQGRNSIMSKRLEIGVLLDSLLIPAWKFEILKEIKSSDFAHLAFLIIKGVDTYNRRKKPVSGNPVFNFHKKIDKWIFTGKNSYSRKINAHELLKDIPVIDVNTIKKEGFEEFNGEDLKKIRNQKPDIILKFGFGPINGEITKIPVYGVWSYSMDKNNTEKPAIIGYYEVIRENPVTVSELLVLGENDDQNRIIFRTWESTCSYSINLNRDKLFWRASSSLPGVIRGTRDYSHDFLMKLEEKYKKDNSKEVFPQLAVPSFLASIGSLAKHLVIILRKIFKKVVYSDPFSWILLFKISDENDLLHTSFNAFRELQPSKDKFWADPFVIIKNGRYFIFVEEFLYSKNKGHISFLELNEKGELLKCQKIIEKPYHMSYPFTFFSGGNYYMIPESGGNRTIDLYKCVSFPGEWVFVKTIMNEINAVDSTLFYYSNKYWLFTVIDKIDSALDSSPELYLFVTDDLFTDKWTSHPFNPVVSDVRTARPAGKIFIHEGKIYRPSQDCSGRYGNAFSLNQILTLNEAEYEEKQILRVEPDWDKKLKGAHTFNFDNNFKIIDAYSFRRRTFF